VLWVLFCHRSESWAARLMEGGL